MTMREFLRMLRAGRYLILAAVVIAVAAAGVFLLRRDAVYESHAVIHLESVDDGGAAGAEFSVNADLNAVRSPETVEAAAKTLAEQGIAPVPPGDVSAQIGESNVLNVYAVASSPEQAAANANAFAAAYVTAISAGVDDQIEDINARRDLLKEQLATVDAQLSAHPSDPLAGAERETIIAQYQALSAQVSLAQSIAAPAQVVGLAQGGETQGFPGSLVLGAALLAGLVVGVGLALVRRAFDTRVRDPEEVGELANADVLADLLGANEAVKEYQKSGVLPVARRLATPFTEGIRQLRTTTYVAVGSGERTMVAITSVDRSARREFIAANLAASFALSGSSTIIVRGDLRRDSLAKLLPLADEAGDGEVRPTTIPNLSYAELPESELDPADYLATQRVREIFARLRQEADVVVVDAPPLLAAADAVIIGGQMDGLVMLATSRTHRVVLSEAAGRVRKNHVRLLGVALTGSHVDRALLSASTYGDTESKHEAVAAAPAHATENDTENETRNDASEVVDRDRRIPEAQAEELQRVGVHGGAFGGQLVVCCLERLAQSVAVNAVLERGRRHGQLDIRLEGRCCRRSAEIVADHLPKHVTRDGEAVIGGGDAVEPHRDLILRMLRQGQVEVGSGPDVAGHEAKHVGGESARVRECLADRAPADLAHVEHRFNRRGVDQEGSIGRAVGDADQVMLRTIDGRAAETGQPAQLITLRRVGICHLSPPRAS